MTKSVNDKCIVCDCENPVHSEGLCQKHAWRLKHHGSLDKPKREIKICLVDGCGEVCSSKGFCGQRDYCSNHYTQFRNQMKCSVDGCDLKYRSRGYCFKHLHLLCDDYSNNICSVEGCEEICVKMGYCDIHYGRVRRYGDPNKFLRIWDPDRGCMFDVCEGKHYRNGYCDKHNNLIFMRDKRIEWKIKVYEYFGTKCVNCGIDDMDVLNLDHINDDGYKEKDGKGRRQSESYKLLLTKITNGVNLKEKYQILCSNCNLKKQVYRNEFNRLEKLGIPPF